MLACVFSNHVNKFYTNIFYTVYIYNRPSHVGRWRKIFFLQCLYSKLLFLQSTVTRTAVSSSPRVPLSLGCGAYKHTARPDTRPLQPCTRSSVCLRMWHTANLLPAFCFSFSPSLYCLSERFPPRFLFPTMHRGLYQGAQEVKRCWDVKPHWSNSLCNLLYFPASLVLPWPCSISNHKVKFYHVCLSCSHTNAAWWLKSTQCSVQWTIQVLTKFYCPKFKWFLPGKPNLSKLGTGSCGRVVSVLLTSNSKTSLGLSTSLAFSGHSSLLQHKAAKATLTFIFFSQKQATAGWPTQGGTHWSTLSLWLQQSQVRETARGNTLKESKVVRFFFWSTTGSDFQGNI